MIKISAYAWLFAALLLPAASSAGPIGPVTKIVVTQRGFDPTGEMCASFSLTDRQIRAFFARAVVISAAQEHDNFNHGPCWVRGTLETRYDTWQWEIRNMGTGSVTATSGDIFLLGDPKQESSLADGE
jgi:hypothetical protein